jgi:hypothetical protein
VYLHYRCRCHPLLSWGWQADSFFQARQKHSDAWNMLSPGMAA